MFVQSIDLPPSVEASYTYLLGLFLGDGCLAPFPRTWGLRISLDAAYPGIIHRCRSAIETVVPGRRITVVRRRHSACIVVGAYWKRWPELLPHGVGRKHLRPITLAPWQEAVVSRHPWQMLRGLLESDGCRSINRVRVDLPSGRRADYEYPRWYFVNASEDILGIFGTTCDLVGVRWTRSRQRMISVSRRASVALLDAHVGPKA